MAFCNRLTVSAGVTVLPVSSPVILWIVAAASLSTAMSHRNLMQLQHAPMPACCMYDIKCSLLQVSAFYVSADPPKYLVRFCFCKTDDKLASACDLLEKYFE